MNKVEIIRGIETTIAGLETIKTALMTEGVKPVSSEENTATPVETEGNVVMSGKFDVEQLNAMKYNEFKKFASSLGVKCTGTRDEIMERILSLDVTAEADVEEVEDEEVEVAPTPKESKKLGKKKEVVEEVDEEEPTTDEFDKMAEEIAKETDIADIIEALADVNVKATKKNAIQKLAEALREGLIEVDDEDEEEEVEVDYEEDEVEEDDEVETVDEDEDGDDDEISATSYFAEYDPKGYNNPKGMTDERAEAIAVKIDEVLTSYSDGDLTDEDITSYIEDNATDEEIDLLGDEYTEEDVLKLYIELIKRTIDNDGEEHEQGEPYEVADKDVCCGYELKYSKKTKKYICEHCGTEYEAE